MKDRYIYPAFFCHYEDGIIGIIFPDLPGCVSQGDSDEDALRMAKEVLALHLWGMEEDADETPAPTPVKQLKPESDQVVVLIEAFMPSIREKMNKKAVTKTVTIPRWLEVEAKAANINCSRVLQEGLMSRLEVNPKTRSKKTAKKSAI
ncbi:MAG: type II toxin-antitoxin system HicB family antitoxin [Thermovirgaceae bacterium]|nr:type II toxin-antitoxin system HicB family antitoxin [Thermovirgaceae bacterium]